MRIVITTPWERRAAERFNDLLDADHPPAHDEHSPMLTLTRQLSNVGERATAHATIDPDFRQRLRTRLVAVASVQGMNDTEPRREPATRVSIPRRAALISATIAILIGLSGVGVASNNALPGDTLYTVKRSREAAQLALAGSDASRASLHIQFAQTRFEEAKSVKGNPEELRRALDDMDADTRTAMRELGGVAVQRGSAAPLDAMDAFIGGQRDGLVDLVGSLRGVPRERALSSLGIIEQVAERSEGLRQSLACTTGNVGSVRTDELGPIPRRCAAMSSMGPGGVNVPGSQPRTSEGQGTGEATTTPGSPSDTSTPPSPNTGGSPNVLPSNPGGLIEPSNNSGVLGSLGAILGGLLGSLTGK